MAKKQEEEFKVTVLTRREISVFPKLDVEVKQYAVTYIAAGLAPNTLTIDKEKWNPDVEKRLIREDIIRRLKEKPVTFTV